VDLHKEFSGMYMLDTLHLHTFMKMALHSCLRTIKKITRHIHTIYKSKFRKISVYLTVFKFTAYKYKDMLYPHGFLIFIYSMSSGKSKRIRKVYKRMI
jgi:hypothetical protein